jgi:hypothetical protein
MEFKVTPDVVANPEPQVNVGLEDVTRSIRALLRTTRNLGTASLEVVERELAMAISVSEQIRDGLVTPQALERSRKQGVISQFRNDAHRTVDLAIDAGSLVFQSALDFLEKYTDTRRQTLPIDNASIKRE